MIIVILIAISLTIALLFLGLFLWSMKSGQYKDTYTPSVRMLFENKYKRPDPPEQNAGSPTGAKSSRLTKVRNP